MNGKLPCLACATLMMVACSNTTELLVDAAPPDAPTTDASLPPDGNEPPAACEDLGYTCGDILDENGILVSCGICNAGTTCVDHRCEDQKPEACAIAGATCGMIDDGSGGTIDCGGCMPPAVCGGSGRPNLCAIPPGSPPTTAGWEWVSPRPLPSSPVDSYAIAADDVWAVGDDGAVRHFDGTAWTEVASGTSNDLRAVWGTSATNVWIAGEDGALLRWDGEVFIPVVAGQGDADLEAIHGTGASDMWIVGDEITLHYDGSSWSLPDATTPSLDGLYVAAPDDVWAIGEDLIWRFDAESGWTSLEQYAPIQRLRGIYGRSPDEIYVVGYFAKSLECDDELVFVWDGTEFTSIDTPADGSIQGIYGSADQVVAVRDAEFCHASSLSVLAGPSTLADPPVSTIGTATQLDANRQFLVTGRGQAFAFDGAAWGSQSQGLYLNLTNLTVIDGQPWAVVLSIGIAQYQGAAAVGHLLQLPPEAVWIAVAGTTETDVWALNYNSTSDLSGPLRHWNGASWGSVELPDPAAGYHAIYAVGTGSVELAGAGIHRYEDGTWTEIWPAEATTAWHALTYDTNGALWAAGDSGETAVVLTDAGGALAEMPVPDLTGACAIAALAANDVWVAGDGGVSHFDGSEWTTTALPGTGAPCSIAAVSSDDVVVAGNSYAGHLYHFDGVAWTALDLLPRGRVAAVATGGEGIYAGGTDGQLLFRP